MPADPVHPPFETRHGCPSGADLDREVPEIDTPTRS